MDSAVCKKCNQVYDKPWVSHLGYFWLIGEAQCHLVSTTSTIYPHAWFYLKDGPPAPCPYKMEHGVAAGMTNVE